MKQPYACKECDGTGTVDCSHCGSEMDCEECGGHGLNADMIHPEAFKTAADRLFKDGMSWEWIEDGVAVGRMNKTDRLAYKDFPPFPIPATNQPPEGASH